MKRLLTITVILALLTVVPLAFSAELITNGSFEQGAKNAQWWQTVPAGSTDITGWTVGGPGVSWASANPSGFGDLNVAFTYQYGTISQSFATTAGQEYLLSFYEQGPKDPNFTNMLQVDLAGHTYVVGYSQDWQHITTNFTAISNITTLTFTGLDDGVDWRWASIDNVSVTATGGTGPGPDPQVPEPASIALLGCGLMFLAGSYRIKIRRRS